MAGLNPHVNGYGVGTRITNARVLDFAMDIVEIEGEPLAKRGKDVGQQTSPQVRSMFPGQCRTS